MPLIVLPLVESNQQQTGRAVRRRCRQVYRERREINGNDVYLPEKRTDKIGRKRPTKYKKFGRFLNFVPNGTSAETLPKNPTERPFGGF
jgi:hypothetical protein